jgi:LacI family transcriptional regulator
LTLDPGYVAEGGYTFESGVTCAETLLHMDPRPTAICALNDEMAAGVYRAAHGLGLSVPGDLSVAGYDDAPIATRLWPPLTTVLLPIRDMGRRAAEILTTDVMDADLRARLLDQPRVMPTLVVRQSTSKPA